MSGTWKVSDSVAALVNKGVAQYLENPGPPDFDYCAGILWSLGGEARLADGRRFSLPPRYELGIVDRADIKPQGFVTIEDSRFGLVAFRPKPEDLASDGRLIDYDGSDIVVRRA